MTVSSVSTSGFVYIAPSDEVSRMVDCVASKLDLCPEDKQKHINKIDLAIKECVVPHLNHFSKNTVSLIRAGDAPHITLFMIISAYAEGKKIEAPIPEFVEALFSDEEMREIERVRELIRRGEVSSFVMEAGAEHNVESFWNCSGLEIDSSAEDISAVFLPPGLRPVKGHRETTFEGGDGIAAYRNKKKKAP